MNNGRDCPHGRQIGRCFDYEVDQLNIEIEALKAENARLREELDKATRALTSAGYTLLEGAQEWKPPIGPSSAPLLDLIDALRAELELKQSNLPEAIYLLYDGSSSDGRGDPDYRGWTTDKTVAEKHKKKCQSSPYYTGRVEVITTTTYKRLE